MLSGPVAHKIYGIPQTINSANYVYFLAYQELQRIHPLRPNYSIQEAVTRTSCLPADSGHSADMFALEELLNLHRGQGMDLYWRENLICPTEPEYIEMVNNSATLSNLLVLKGADRDSRCRDGRIVPYRDQVDDGSFS
jgi:geranylgeranyl diphosphate synthase type 3